MCVPNLGDRQQRMKVGQFSMTSLDMASGTAGRTGPPLEPVRLLFFSGGRGVGPGAGEGGLINRASGLLPSQHYGVPARGNLGALG